MKGSVLNRQLVFRFTSWTGRDLWRLLQSQKRQAAAVGRKLMRPGGPFGGQDPDANDLIVDMPGGAYRIVDEAGHVEAFTGKVERGPA